jgi:hypothetical protein
MSFDYNAPAELFLSKQLGPQEPSIVALPQRLKAIRCAIEVLRTPKAFGARLKVGDQRLNSNDILRLYEAEDYPSRKI